MTSEAGIVLMTKDESTVELVSSTLDANHKYALEGLARDVSELRTTLGRLPDSTVLVDMDSYPAGFLRTLNSVVIGYPDARLVVVSSTFDESQILEAMQAGARHFMRKSSVPDELERVIDALLDERGVGKSVSGQAITVFSASGGCGATTIAVNLANELRMISDKRVLAVDLDAHYGTIADYLGVKSSYGIIDVLRSKESLDRDLVESSACSYMENFDVLLSPATTNGTGAGHLSFEHIISVMEACKDVYDFTVVDAPRVERKVALDLAAASTFCLLVMQLTVRDLRFARSLVGFLLDNGIPSEKIVPIANRVRKRGGHLVRLEDSRQAIGLRSFTYIRSDWKTAMKGVDHGQPLARVAKRSGLRKDFRRLAVRIHNRAEENN